MNRHAVGFARFAADALDGGCSMRAVLSALSNNGATSTIRKTATSVLTLLERGYTFPEACLAQPIFSDKLWRKHLGETTCTGKVHTALEIALSDIELKESLRAGALGALPYPAAVLGLTLAGTVWLLGWGIPMLSASGTAGGLDDVHAMKQGVLEALLFLAASATALIALFSRRASTLSRRSGFWSALEQLSAAGIGFEDSIAAASKEWASGGENMLSGLENLNGLIGVYERTVILGALETGEYAQAFHALAERQKKITLAGFSTLEKLIEPAVTAAAGVAFLILTAEVFLPLMIQGSAIL